MKKLIFLFVAAAVAIGFSACGDKDDAKLRDITVNFTSHEVGIGTEDDWMDVTLNLSRVSESDITIVVGFSSDDVVYGTDYMMEPALEDNTVTVTIPAGSAFTAITVYKVPNVLFEGTETIKFTILSISDLSGVIIGTRKESTLLFGPIVSKGQTLTLEGKTDASPYANEVYVDFSNNQQTPVARTSWDLGFYCGDDDFRVILNPGYATTATASTKTDIAQVTLADAEAALNIAVNPMNSDGLLLSSTVVDKYDGSLTGTVFAAVSTNEAENKVYFVASEVDKSGRDQWYKVKVNRKGDGYTVQYAKVGGTEITTVDIPKNAAYNFRFLSLATGTVVNAEPEREKWDIVWGYGVAQAGPQPYFMQDMVSSNNLGGVETVEVIATAEITYEKFVKAHLRTLTFSDTRNVIANNWRTISNGMPGGPGGTSGIKADRFYIVKDPAGNYYKLRFLKFGLANDGGERGRPVIQYALVK